MKAQLAHKPLPAAGVVTKAFFRAADLLHLSRHDISQILGLSEPTLSRIINKKGLLSVEAKEGEIALLFLRFFRSLDSLFGGNEDNMTAWFNAPNTALHGIPKEQIKTLQGLFHVAEYLDAMRGKV